jgi:hypothetical protein
VGRLSHGFKRKLLLQLCHLFEQCQAVIPVVFTLVRSACICSPEMTGLFLSGAKMMLASKFTLNKASV